MLNLEKKILLLLRKKPLHRDTLFKRINRLRLFNRCAKLPFNNALHTLESTALIEELSKKELDAINEDREFSGVISSDEFIGFYCLTDTGGCEVAEEIIEGIKRFWLSLLVPDIASIVAVVISIVSLCVSCSSNQLP